MIQVNEEEMEKGLEAALEAGYRHIDTAYIYKTEATIGTVLKRWISSGKLKSKPDLPPLTIKHERAFRRRPLHHHQAPSEGQQARGREEVPQKVAGSSPVDLRRSVPHPRPFRFQRC